MFTKTRQDALMRMHCKSDSETGTVNTAEGRERRLLNTLMVWNCARVKPLLVLLSPWTANKRARTTDSENTVAMRTLTGFDCEQDLTASEDAWNSRMWVYSKHSVHHRGCPTFKFSSSKRQDFMSGKVAYFLFMIISKQQVVRPLTTDWINASNNNEQITH